MPISKLSKTDYILGLQCPLALWFKYKKRILSLLLLYVLKKKIDDKDSNSTEFGGIKNGETDDKADSGNSPTFTNKDGGQMGFGF